MAVGEAPDGNGPVDASRDTAATGTSLADLTAQQVRMAAAPLATVTELAYEAMGRPLGSPSPWPRAVRDALEPHDVALLGAVYGPAAPIFVPDCLTPTPSTYSMGLDDELERLAEVAAEELEAEIAASGLGSASWSVAATSPRRWIHAYVIALRRAWAGVKPLWQQAAPLIEREVERVGTALARGAFAHLMADLSPRGRVEDDRWYIRDGDPPAVIATGLVLQPMLAGPKARLIGVEAGKVSYLAYPLPGAHRLTDRTPSPNGTPLEALLGEPRADILRRLDRPLPAGRLADELLFAPSAITHHLTALERAGLARRERNGRHVLVHRTGRGTALLHLYER